MAIEGGIPAATLVQRFLSAKQAGDFLEAGLRWRRILDACPRELLKDDLLARALAAPDLFTRVGQLDEYFHYLDGLVGGLHEFALLRDDLALSARLAQSFMLGSNLRMVAHTDFSAKPFMKKRAALFDYALRAIGMPLDHAFAPRPASRRLRLGILLKHFNKDPETTSILPFFEHLDGDLIERHVLGMADGEGAFREHLRGLAHRSTVLPKELPDAARAIRELDLDFLIFGGDITAKPSPMTLLSFFRLARQSMTAVCALTTTGGAQVDTYLTGSYYQARGFDSEFTERCVAVGRVGFAFSFGPEYVKRMPVLPARSAISRPDRVTLVSGANFTKLNADLLQVWARILAARPQARLVLYPFPAHYGKSQRAAVVEHVVSQLSAGGAATGQIEILATIPGREAVIDLTAGADLALDSFPYPGVTTVVDHLEACLPLVALEGNRLRTSQSAAILRSVGLETTLTRDQDAYVDMATALIDDAPRREALRHEIRRVYADTVPEVMDAAAMGRRMQNLLVRLAG